MGFGNWLLKNGPGSPGSTAKSILNVYLQLTNERDAVPQAAWTAIYFGRHEVSVRTRNQTAKFDCFDPDALYNYCNGDLALFTFIILYIETQQFRNGISMGVDGFNSTLAVIKEVIQKKAPHLITLDATAYRQRAQKFMNDIFLSETTRDY